jgi:aminoglycoside 6-adenylyltransferase
MEDDRSSQDLPPTEADWDRLLERFIAWAEGNDEVRAAAIIGSRARTDREADRWSDLDMLLFVNDPAPFVNDTGWLDELGKVWVTLDHEGPIPGLLDRQVLYEGGLDVDIIPLPRGSLSTLLADPKARDAIGKGIRPVIDKDGELASIDLDDVEPPSPPALGEPDYVFLVSDFLFQVVWCTKHLRRGELWIAKRDVDGYMKDLLLRMIEWHGRLKEADVATWGITSFGRLLEEWAAPWILDELAGTFATYDRKDIGRALLELIELFRKVASEVGQLAGYRYPDDVHEAVQGWARAHLVTEAPAG